jgi:hypothetical protein
MASHVYVVTEAFSSVGPAGLTHHLVGDEVVLDRQARPSRHLQFVRTDDGPSPKDQLANALAEVARLTSECASLREMLSAQGGGGPGVPTVATEAVAPARRSR